MGRVGHGGQTALERGLSDAPSGPRPVRDAQDDADEVRKWQRVASASYLQLPTR